jgi:uncharacterized protein (DUF697 family)
VNLNSAVKLLREVDLREIQREADAGFTLLVVGDRAASAALALALSSAATDADVHPWIRCETVPLPPEISVQKPVVGCLVTGSVTTPADLQAARQRLQQKGVFLVTVIQSDAAMAQQRADLTRPGEDRRVVLPSLPSPNDIRDRLAPALLAATHDLDGLQLAMARQFPPLREPFARHLIDRVSRANAAYAASSALAEVIPGVSFPLTVADVVILTKNQLIMAYRIALAAGKPGETRDLIGEIVTVIGGGFLFRQVARELVGLIPIVGIVPRIAVAYAGTRIVGEAVRVWALEGRLADRTELQKHFQASIGTGREIANDLRGRLGRNRLRGRHMPSLPVPRKPTNGHPT